MTIRSGEYNRKMKRSSFGWKFEKYMAPVGVVVVVGARRFLLAQLCPGQDQLLIKLWDLFSKADALVPVHMSVGCPKLAWDDAGRV